MTESYPCPRCNTEVPAPGYVRGGPATTDYVAEANQERAECPQCKAMLYRVVDLPDPSWQLDPRAEQPPPA